MTLLIAPTPLILEVNGAICRVWKGVSADPSIVGTVTLYVCALACRENSPLDAELRQHLTDIEEPTLVNASAEEVVQEMIESLDQVEAVGAALLWESATAEQKAYAKQQAFRLMESARKAVHQ